ncbi:hypothetical protein [Paenibacillus sp. NPDC058174]
MTKTCICLIYAGSERGNKAEISFWQERMYPFVAVRLKAGNRL